MTNKYVVRPLPETEYDRWAQFVARSPSGSLYALPAYLDILCGATGGRFTVCGIFHGDELVGGMPLYLAKSRVGLVATPRSLLAYPGPVIRDYAAHVPSERSARQLAGLTALRNYLLTVNSVHMTLSVRHFIPDIRPFLTGGWRVEPNYTYIVDIADLPAAWSRVSQNLRRLIKRAAGHGLSVTDDDDFASFYRLHYDTHKRKNSPLYLPEAAFCTYLARLRAQGWCRLYHARLPDGRAIATELCSGQQHVERKEVEAKMTGYGQPTSVLSPNDSFTTKSTVPEMGRNRRYRPGLSKSTGQCRDILLLASTV